MRYKGKALAAASGADTAVPGGDGCGASCLTLTVSFIALIFLHACPSITYIEDSVTVLYSI